MTIRQQFTKIFGELSWRGVTVLCVAPLIFIAPPIWFGYAGFGLILVFGFGLLTTLFAFFLARLDGMKLSLCKGGIRMAAVTYMQITAIFLIFFLVGKAASS